MAFSFGLHRRLGVYWVELRFGILSAVKDCGCRAGFDLRLCSLLLLFRTGNSIPSFIFWSRKQLDVL